MIKKIVLAAAVLGLLGGCKSVSVRHSVELPVQVVETHHLHHSPHVVVTPPPPVIVQQHVHVLPPPHHSPPAHVHGPAPTMVIRPRPPAPSGIWHRHQHQEGMGYRSQPPVQRPPEQANRPLPAGPTRPPASREKFLPPLVKRGESPVPPVRKETPPPSAARLPRQEGSPQATGKRDAASQQASQKEQRSGPRS